MEKNPMKTPTATIREILKGTSRILEEYPAGILGRSLGVITRKSLKNLRWITVRNPGTNYYTTKLLIQNTKISAIYHSFAEIYTAEQDIRKMFC